MVRVKYFFIVVVFVLVGRYTSAAQGLKDVIGKDCLIGAAINQSQSAGVNTKVTAIIDKHFNCLVAENCMKAESVQPREGEFDFRAADEFVRFAEQHGQKVIGHCLVWHSQAPAWFFTDSQGKPVSREVLIERMRKHITTVVGRYKGRIHGWDVVNEAIEDDGSYRRSPYYNIIGEDYFELAFKMAHEADPDAELYYNDFSMGKPGKREGVCRLVKRLRAAGCRIDAVGMQSHNGMDYPNLDDYEKSIEAFAGCGVKVMVTELDLNVLPSPRGFGGASVEQNFEYQKKLTPYRDGLPKDVARKVADRYMDFFRIYHRHRDKIARITLWGVGDGDSWLNNWPVHGRTNYPLLFDRQYREKPVVKRIIKMWKTEK